MMDKKLPAPLCDAGILIFDWLEAYGNVSHESMKGQAVRKDEELT